MASVLIILVAVLFIIAIWYTINIGYPEIPKEEKKVEDSIPVAPILTEQVEVAETKKPRKPRAKKTS